MPAKNLGPFTGRQLTTIIVAVIAAMMIPTGAYAVTAVTHAVIQDQTTKTPAGVTPTGNLKVAEAAPGAFFQNASVFAYFGASAPVGVPVPGSALVVTTIHIDTFADPTPGAGENLVFLIVTGSTCAGSQVGTYSIYVNPGEIGETDLPLAPGLGIPAGDALCALANGSINADVSVSGYTVPAGTVAAGALHALRTLRQQR